MWKPSENTSAYAYHIQVATDEHTVGVVGVGDDQTDDGEQTESLVVWFWMKTEIQDMENEGGHIVVNETSSEMKPMTLELHE